MIHQTQNSMPNPFAKIGAFLTSPIVHPEPSLCLPTHAHTSHPHNQPPSACTSTQSDDDNHIRPQPSLANATKPHHALFESLQSPPRGTPAAHIRPSQSRVDETSRITTTQTNNATLISAKPTALAELGTNTPHRHRNLRRNHLVRTTKMGRKTTPEQATLDLEALIADSPTSPLPLTSPQTPTSQPPPPPPPPQSSTTPIPHLLLKPRFLPDADAFSCVTAEQARRSDELAQRRRSSTAAAAGGVFGLFPARKGPSAAVVAASALVAAREPGRLVLPEEVAEVAAGGRTSRAVAPMSAEGTQLPRLVITSPMGVESMPGFPAETAEVDGNTSASTRAPAPATSSTSTDAIIANNDTTITATTTPTPRQPTQTTTTLDPISTNTSLARQILTTTLLARARLALYTRDFDLAASCAQRAHVHATLLRFPETLAECVEIRDEAVKAGGDVGEKWKSECVGMGMGEREWRGLRERVREIEEREERVERGFRVGLEGLERERKEGERVTEKEREGRRDKWEREKRQERQERGKKVDGRVRSLDEELAGCSSGFDSDSESEDEDESESEDEDEETEGLFGGLRRAAAH